MCQYLCPSLVHSAVLTTSLHSTHTTPSFIPQHSNDKHHILGYLCNMHNYIIGYLCNMHNYMAPFKVFWPLTLTNVSIFEFLKVYAFPPKRKLLLKIGTCKDLKLICKNLTNNLGVRTICLKFGFVQLFSKYTIFVPLFILYPYDCDVTLTVSLI